MNLPRSGVLSYSPKLQGRKPTRKGDDDEEVYDGGSGRGDRARWFVGQYLGGEQKPAEQPATQPEAQPTQPETQPETQPAQPPAQ